MKLTTLNPHRVTAATAALAALSLAGTAFSQAAAPGKVTEAPAAEKKVDANAPKLTLAKEKIDVGTVAKGETIHQTFVVKNEGKSDLHITDVKPSCGCTVPEYDKVVKPGAEGKIVLNVDTKNFQGPISKTALILTDDPTTPQTTIFLTANVKPYVETLPYGFFRIQALTGEPATSEMILVSDEPDFKPTKAEVAQTFLKAAIAPASEKERIAGKNPNQYKVTLTASPDTPEGLLSGYVKVQTGVKKQPELDLAISGFVKPTVTITPGSVNFGNYDPKGDAVKRKIMLVNNNVKNEGFTVTKAESNVDGISAEVKLVENDKTRIEVVLSVDANKVKKGVFDGNVLIKTNDAAKAEIRVPIKGVIL